MTAKIINLGKARKAKKRAEKQKAATENREKFGRSKGDKLRDMAHKAKTITHLDGHKIDDNKDNNDD